MAGSFRACPRHLVELEELVGRPGRLRCPRDHVVTAWVVLLDGQVVGAGREDTHTGCRGHNRPSAAWLAPEAFAYVRYEARMRTGPVNLGHLYRWSTGADHPGA